MIFLYLYKNTLNFPFILFKFLSQETGIKQLSFNARDES